MHTLTYIVAGLSIVILAVSIGISVATVYKANRLGRYRRTYERREQ